MDILQILSDYRAILLLSPLWLLQILLQLAFFLHVIPMNLTLGCGALSSVFLFLGRHDRSSYANMAGSILARALPLLIFFAIALGIVPFLFLQLLYGPILFNSLISMAIPWLWVVPILIVASYSSYWVIYKYLERPDFEIDSRTMLQSINTISADSEISGKKNNSDVIYSNEMNSNEMNSSVMNSSEIIFASHLDFSRDCDSVYERQNDIKNMSDVVPQSKNDRESIFFRASLVLLFVFILFSAIALVFVGNTSLMLQPIQGSDILNAGRIAWTFPTIDMCFCARYAHILLSSFAISGLGMAFLGLCFYRDDSCYSDWLIKRGSMIYLIVTLIQLLVGSLYLACLPRKYMLNFLGAEPIGTAAFAISLFFMVVSIAATGISASSSSRVNCIVGLVSALITVFAMVVMRHQLRSYYLDKLAGFEYLPVDAQWLMLIVLFLCSLALFFYLAWLARLIWVRIKPTASITESGEMSV